MGVGVGGAGAGVGAGAWRCQSMLSLKLTDDAAEAGSDRNDE